MQLTVDGPVATITMDDRDVTRIQRNVQRHMEAVEAAEREARWIDAGYYLVFPLIALALITFRRGWTVRWALVALLVLGLMPSQDSTHVYPGPQSTAAHELVSGTHVGVHGHGCVGSSHGAHCSSQCEPAMQSTSSLPVSSSPTSAPSWS